MNEVLDVLFFVLVIFFGGTAGVFLIVLGAYLFKLPPDQDASVDH